MFVLIRALTYAALFIGLVLIYVPAQILSQAGIVRPEMIGWPQAVGAILATIGGVIALWCVLTFANIGKGTPAPFDPPRQLVTRGPYQFVRNPMYLGAGMALIGAALFYDSLLLLGYVVVFFVIVHFFIVLYEEPTLQRTFADEYEQYYHKVKRWLPSGQEKGNQHA